MRLTLARWPQRAQKTQGRCVVQIQHVGRAIVDASALRQTDLSRRHVGHRTESHDLYPSPPVHLREEMQLRKTRKDSVGLGFSFVPFVTFVVAFLLLCARCVSCSRSDTQRQRQALVPFVLFLCSLWPFRAARTALSHGGACPRRCRSGQAFGTNPSALFAPRRLRVSFSMQYAAQAPNVAPLPSPTFDRTSLSRAR